MIQNCDFFLVNIWMKMGVKCQYDQLLPQLLSTHPKKRSFLAVQEPFSSDGKLPATIIKEFRGKDSKPVLKAAYIDSDIFFGDEQLETLTKLKTKKELIGDVIFLLQSPASRVVSSLKSGGTTIAGLLKTLEER